MLEPAHLLALAERRVAGNDVGAAIAQVQQRVEEVQPDAGHQHRGHRHQRQRRMVRSQAAPTIAARSFLQNSRSTRFSAIGLTFQVSPEM